MYEKTPKQCKKCTKCLLQRMRCKKTRPYNAVKTGSDCSQLDTVGTGLLLKSKTGRHNAILYIIVYPQVYRHMSVSCALPVVSLVGIFPKWSVFGIYLSGTSKPALERSMAYSGLFILSSDSRVSFSSSL